MAQLRLCLWGPLWEEHGWHKDPNLKSPPAPDSDSNTLLNLIKAYFDISISEKLGLNCLRLISAQVISVLYMNAHLFVGEMMH